jgi:hypothetical protein
MQDVFLHPASPSGDIEATSGGHMVYFGSVEHRMLTIAIAVTATHAGHRDAYALLAGPIGVWSVR